VSSKCVAKRSAGTLAVCCAAAVRARALRASKRATGTFATRAQTFRLARPERRGAALIALRARGGARSVAFRAQRTSFAHGIERGRTGASLHGAPRALLHLRHSPPSVSLTTVRVARVPFRSRAAADQFASLISTPCASLPRDCPILRFRAGLCLSQGPVRLSVRDELWSDMPHALHLIPSELAATLWSHISMLPNAHACILSFSSSLCGSQDDRDAHQVCSGEDQRPQKGSLLGRLFPGRDQDCLWFMGQDDQSLGFGCAFAITSRLLGQN